MTRALNAPPGFLTAIPNLEGVAAVRVYQKTLSPKIAQSGRRCLYQPTCSNYAVFALRRFSLIPAVYKTWLRLRDCNWYARLQNRRPTVDYP